LSHPKKPTQLGKNRTGIAVSPIDAPLVLEGATEDPLVVDGVPQLLPVRTGYSREAEPLGTMPPPATLKGMAKTAIDKLRGRNPMVLLDKLGERLAYERTGVRLYEALVAKYEASEARDPDISAEALLEIRDDELFHVGLLTEAIVELGGDPTAMTPCADLMGVASMGFAQALTDPRTTFTQGLDVILAVELADHASWELLIELTTSFGLDDLSARFQRALLDEQRHLVMVRGWLQTQVIGQAGVIDEALAEQPMI
jgi:hypothetical protein